MKRALAALAVLASLVWFAPAAAQTAYAIDPGRTCDGYPRIKAELADGLCIGLVWQHGSGGDEMRMPRDLAPGSSASEWLITDLGGWGTRRGAVWRLSAPLGRPASLTKLLDGLEMPHTILPGPNGVYVGEMGRIIAFNPFAAEPQSTLRTVVDGLPSNRLHDNRHPLSTFIFGKDGSLLVNVGAPSDDCLEAKPKIARPRCPEGEGENPQAVVRRYGAMPQGSSFDQRYTIFSSGLRNSVAMTLTATGAILQAENSVDLRDAASPFDEINALTAGRHYGWPYCLNRRTPAPGWKEAGALDCASPAHTGPAVLLPPHSAPLAMATYDRKTLARVEGKLLVTLHGFRGDRARLLAFSLNENGLPFGKPLVVWRWDGQGKRPRPVGLRVAADGSIWMADDRNQAILRLAAATSAAPRP